MPRIRPALAVALACALPACDTPSTSMPPITTEAGVVHFDAAMLAHRDAGALEPDAGGPSDLPPAVVSPDGVLTPFPSIRVTVTPPELSLETLNFVVTHDGDSRGPLVTMYAELRNDGIDVECGFVPDVWLDAFEIVTVVEAEPFYDRYSSGTLSTTTSDCIPPGGSGVLEGVQRGLDEADLALASHLVIDARPFRSSFTERVAPTDAPTLDVAVVEGAEGWSIEGTMTPRRTIRNYAFRAYARDARGVLFAELLAFPGELATLPPFVAQTIATDVAPRSFTDHRSFQSWIVE